MKPDHLVQNVNRLPYPPTIWAHGWIYGVWYCSTSWQKAIYHGQFPSTFVKRIRTMFDGARMLHLCCGRCRIPDAVNMDLMPLPEDDLRGNVERLPFRANAFDAILIDPPYTTEDANKYGVKRLPRAARVMAESKRVLKPGGWLCWLDTKYPTFKRKEWDLKGLICIVTGFQRKVRILSMFRKPGGRIIESAPLTKPPWTKEWERRQGKRSEN